MVKLLRLSLLFFALLGSAADVVPHDQTYYTAKIRNTELIYTQKNLPFAKMAAAIQLQLQPQYEALYGYVMDEPIIVGLLSDYNQIANGFSTPYPNNRQMNYIGGAMLVDYFSSTSWLKALLCHEAAHNYQMNAKDNSISSTLHDIFRNGAVFNPLWTLPNTAESSFLLEGNAVLNESYHGNGGRLYSGRFLAETLMQARAGYLTPERLYNDHYFFLYGSHHYTLGGYYHYFLAQQYGLKATNSYWKKHSQDWFWPFFTNNSMLRAVGVDFESSLAQWRRSMEARAERMTVISGDLVASSQFFMPLSSNSEEIFFLINESGREAPELVRLNKENLHVNTEHRSLIAGKVLKVEGAYVTQAGAMISPFRIYQGLFDDGAYLVPSTRSKVIQGYLQDGRAVYFDVPTSFDQPQLYVGEAFYAQVNSSVFIDAADNLYYFKQKGKTRILYKNRTPLMRVQGYYATVCDVDADGAVYFIGASPYGSTLYRVNKGRVERLSRGDTIIDARLIDNTRALVALVGSDAYTYEIVALEAEAETPFETVLYFEDNASLFTTLPSKPPTVAMNHSYSSLGNMNYSGTDFEIGADENNTLLYHVSINFADPLGQNAVSLFSLRNADAVTLAGASYSNSQYLLRYGLTAYGVVDSDDNRATRDYGMVAEAMLPFLKRGYYSGDVTTRYLQDYETQSREPLSISLNLMRQEHYGVSMFPNALSALSLFGLRDRDNSGYGGRLRFEQHLWRENYIAVSGQYVSSDADSSEHDRGVKLSSSLWDTLGDPATVVMPSLRHTRYVQKATAVRTSVKSVFNLSAYYFTFPISLRREALELAYSYYDIEDFDDRYDAQELSVGITFDTLWLNRQPVPITITYVYNDNEQIAKHHNAYFSVGMEF